jgi:hypothetical protein
MITGTCHCGSVAYQSDGPIVRVAHCHCDDCRRISGATFNTALVVATSGFHVTKGESDLTAYESSPGKFRCFCKKCGSPIHAYMNYKPEITIIRAGLVNETENVKPQAHIWVKAKAPWHRIFDDLPQHQEGFPAK